jgi:hypothetical protein
VEVKRLADVFPDPEKTSKIEIELPRAYRPAKCAESEVLYRLCLSERSGTSGVARGVGPLTRAGRLW